MVEWVQNDHVTLERWDKYFKSDRPYLDRVVMKAIGDDSVRLTGLQTGELGWIQRVPLQSVSQLKNSNQIKATAARPYLPDFINLNATRPPFNDVRVRRAVAWAIDKKEIAKLVYFDQAVPATEAVSRPNPLYSGLDPYAGAPDPDGAKSLLKQAGASNLNVVFAAQPNVTTQVRTGEVLKAQLAKAGINMTIQNYAPAQWFDAWLGHKYDVTTSYWSLTNDPVFLYNPLTKSSSPFNVTGLKSSRIDQSLKKYYATIGQQTRKAAYQDLVRAVAEEAALIFIDNEFQQYWMQPKVFGSAPLPHLDIRLESMWVQA
jgi:peptide/nickel transport system substrate-binding protein